MYRLFLRNGLGIGDGPNRRRFTDMRKELQALKVAYLKSLKYSTGIWLTVQELDGLPMNSIAGLKTGDGKNPGRVWLPFKKPHFKYAIRIIQGRSTRRKIFIGRDNRCLDNVPRLKATVLLRDEAARLLGYSNHAEFKFMERMAESTYSINPLIKDVKNMLTPHARLESETLSKLK
jgi:metallopeptidase MepB